MSRHTCSKPRVAQCGDTQPGCVAYGCQGHLLSDCSAPATHRINGADGWSQQYACGEHLVDFDHAGATVTALAA